MGQISELELQNLRHLIAGYETTHCKLKEYANCATSKEVKDFFEKGAQGNMHSHVHEQITYIAEGKFLFTIDGETREVCKGDSVYMPSGAEHGVTCLEEGRLVDVFSPIREDFLK